MSSNVTTGHFGGAPFRELDDLEAAIWDAIMQFEGRVSTMSVVGVIRLIEHRLLSDA